MAARDPSPSPWIMKRYGGGTVDTSRAPDFWLSRPDQIEAFFRSLTGVEVFELGTSAGGRPIIAAAWGEREDLPGRTSTSLSSALSGGGAECFYGEGKRRRQGFLFLGATHGTEIEGTVAAINLLNVVVTGTDLRGKAWPRLAQAARQLRLVIIPIHNVDGRERYHDYLHGIGIDPDEYRRITDGAWKNGEVIGWPTSMRHFPIPLDRIARLGSYFNDRGVNLMNDLEFGDGAQPETCAYLDFLRTELPDCVLLSHSDNGSLVQPPDSFIPERHRRRQVQIGAIVSSRLQRDGAVKHGLNTRLEYFQGRVFWQSDQTYHTCGALPVVVEFPCGHQNLPDNHGDILNIGLTILEEIICFGVAYGFRQNDAVRE